MRGLNVTPEILNFLFLHIFRDEKVFNASISRLKTEFFTEKELVYSIIWQMLCDYYAEYHSMPMQETFNVLLRSRIALENETLKQEVIQLVSTFYDKTIVPDSQLNSDIALELLRLVVSRYYKVSLETSLMTIEDLNLFPKSVEQFYDNFVRDFSLNQYPIEQLIPKDLSIFAPDMYTFSSGIDFIDSSLGGGMRNKEVYTLLGPTGSGKSLLATQLCTARREAEGLRILFSYELSKHEMYFRAICQAARITPERLQAIIEERATLEEHAILGYERQLFSDIPESLFVREAVRFVKAIDYLNKFCRFVDFSGAERTKTHVFGSGGLDEVTNYLTELKTRIALPIRSVVIDWAGAALRREAELHQGDINRYMTQKLAEYVQKAHEKVATKFDCPVWIVHQLAGNVADRGPNYIPHHTHADWCKSFAQFAWYSFALGNPLECSEEAKLFVCSKYRRVKAPPMKIVAIDLSLNFVDRSNVYSFDPKEGLCKRLD